MQLDETISTNGMTGPVSISVCIPAWKDSAGPLLSGLAKQAGISSCEVIVYDDGSDDNTMTSSIISSLSNIQAPAKLITATENIGRARARNRLIAEAKADWLLLLDADMLPDSSLFLSKYREAMESHVDPALIAGGFSLDQVTPTNAQRLHAAQSIRSECVSAEMRAKHPGLHVFSSNILVHRKVLDTVQFDEEYSGWGWEDIDWGLRIARQFDVLHIDNTATHLGLDDDASLIKKYGTSADNFARLARQHPQDVSKMKLYKMVKRLQKIPAQPIIKSISHSLAASNNRLLPIKLRLFSLKLFRAATYAEALK